MALLNCTYLEPAIGEHSIEQVDGVGALTETGNNGGISSTLTGRSVSGINFETATVSKRV